MRTLIRLLGPVGLMALMVAIASSQAGARQHATNTPAHSADIQRAVRAVLDEQVAAWNRGDIEGYMVGYWRSPELTFYSGGAVTSGWDATLARYKTRYQGQGREMGKLDFSNLEIHSAAGDSAWAGGRWHLKMSGGKGLGGLFTLIFKKVPEGWRIVHDHTSSE